jgi:hypothetical protein
VSLSSYQSSPIKAFRHTNSLVRARRAVMHVQERGLPAIPVPHLALGQTGGYGASEIVALSLSVLQ